ncbi:[FeFe] hydrogenase H-cluster radical SAM maturase HydG [Suipraeoptans intestinalis]|uniref:[FeFe] hydrogenase H-cluster radical SAM maturase HydG n=1 Tax=Suipraeoptans intestinalis TaxID=2606628 RepID=UPI0023EF584A|nr:[FeFe] hydrogenase H-cluster radical SAM maturase HydG [Suipraeoptans intestinalis]MDD7769412.1 [FeFe] hydrogenase H-cluster radical SAM maturase HydG [Suipraeoptans intestinalis]MDY3121025.1 [FeFe] hydrogenase H-cluster radical SAM maturase HydG [Suipraeoptans intestinalis]
MYDVHSKHAEDFINHQEILDTLAYADENCHNTALMEALIQKAALRKGLSHREASLLLACQDPQLNEKIFRLAQQIKKDFYGNRIVLFAPLYLSNYCVNGCTYCPYHLKNKTIRRKKLTQEEIRREVIALQDMGHKRLALEAGEDPVHNTMDYYLESIETIYSIRHKNGAIRRANINIAATTTDNYRLLKEAGIGTYILFQETYHKESYLKLHPAGPKHDYDYHTEAMDRAMEGGVDDVGIGVLFGLDKYRYEFAGLLMHAEHLEAAFGVGPHTISVPRLRDADDIDSSSFKNGIDDATFEKIVACIRISVPYTGMIVSTRESKDVRQRVLQLGISQISGGSKTSVGGYYQPETDEDNSKQFDINDDRTLDEVVHWLMEMDYIPSFCTACYREGRTGDRFMSLCKSGQIQNCCHPNALMTLQEYLMDYASPSTRALGETIIDREVANVPNLKARSVVLENLRLIRDNNRRDFRF